MSSSRPARGSRKPVQARQPPETLALAKHAGLRTLNVVRRADSVRPLLDAGADAVLVEDTVAQTYRQLATLVADRTLAARIEATYTLADYHEAIAHAARSDRHGKVLFAL
jgi:NADPH:quinone reductase-like Zn-dependent oxidoreductase